MLKKIKDLCKKVVCVVFKCVRFVVHMVCKILDFVIDKLDK